MNPFDQALMAFVQSNCHNAVTDRIFPIITYLGESGLFWILLALLTGEVAIKNLVCRPRPFQEISADIQLLIPPPSGWSFPSGHSCASFAAATSIFLKDKRWGAAALVLAALCALAVRFAYGRFAREKA